MFINTVYKKALKTILFLLLSFCPTCCILFFSWKQLTCADTYVKLVCCMKELYENITRTYNSILMLILTLDVISVSEPSHKQKLMLEKGKIWKGHSTFFIQKANLACSKWNWNANLGTSVGLWTVVIFFCWFSKYLELQLRMSTLILYFLLLDVVAKYCIKIFFFVLNYIWTCDWSNYSCSAVRLPGFISSTFSIHLCLWWLCISVLIYYII